MKQKKIHREVTWVGKEKMDRITGGVALPEGAGIMHTMTNARHTNLKTNL